MIQKKPIFAEAPLQACITLTIVVLLLLFFKNTAAHDNQKPGDDMDAGTAEQLDRKTTIPFVTLRNKISESGAFGGQRGRLHAGTCKVSFSPIWMLEELASSAPFYVPNEKVAIDEIRESSFDELLGEIEAFSRNENGSTVVYIHGYNIDFEKGCRHSALLQRSLGLHDRLLLFSWPADGNMFKYTWDEADLVWSAPYMADFFEDLVNSSGYGNADIVAHSLGARGALQALTRLAYQEHDRPLFGELVLIAPDIDVDIFRHDLPLLRRVVDRITIYVSENDKALKLSREVHGYPRLGEAGAALTTFEGVETIDISLISLQRLSGHVYHLSNKEVIDDLAMLLNSSTPAAKRPQMEKRIHEGITYWRLMPEEKQ